MYLLRKKYAAFAQKKNVSTKYTAFLRIFARAKPITKSH
jgi:hypothetical protein